MNTSPSNGSHDPNCSAADRELRMTRVFKAPRDLVFEVCTNPVHVPKWWACPDSEMLVCEIDLREGGAYRYVMGIEGSEYAFTGVYLEIERPQRLVFTQIYEVEPWQNDAAMVTMTFEETGGQTTLHASIVFPHLEGFKAATGSGMEAGMTVAYDRLAEVLSALQAESYSIEAELAHV